MSEARVVLITGSGRGLGRAVADQLAARGEVVYAGVRNMKRARQDFKGCPANLRVIELDVTKSAHIKRAMNRIKKEAGRLDVLVNNAGYGLYGAFEELSDRDYRAQFETNFFGSLALARAVLPIMRAQQSGWILNIGSILGKLTIPTGSAYCATKHAMEAWSEALRYETFPFGIHVTLIEPGLVRTSFKASTVFTPSSTDDRSPYRFVNAMMNREYEGFFTPVDRAAARIVAISDKRRPATRYTVGRDAWLYSRARTLLPDFLFDVLIKRRLRRNL